MNIDSILKQAFVNRDISILNNALNIARKNQNVSAIKRLTAGRNILLNILQESNQESNQESKQESNQESKQENICQNSTDLFTGEEISKIEKLIIIPFAENKNWCFELKEIAKWMFQTNKNPYTKETFTEKQQNKILKALENNYPLDSDKINKISEIKVDVEPFTTICEKGVADIILRVRDEISDSNNWKEVWNSYLQLFAAKKILDSCKHLKYPKRIYTTLDLFSEKIRTILFN